MKLSLAGLGIAVAGCAMVGNPPQQGTYFDQEGLRVSMEVAGLDKTPGEVPITEFEDLELRFRVSEAGDLSKAIVGLDPLAWLTRRDEDEGPDRATCKYEIRGLLAGRLARAADVNLNEYLLITLDDNNSVSIIDPQIESSMTKTLGMVSLTAKGTDFVLSPDRRTVFVTLQTQGRVAAADIFSHKARYLDLGGSPRRIALQPDGQIAWVGDAVGGVVSAFDTTKFEAVGAIDVGPGPHEFAFRDDSRILFVGSPGDSKLNVIDTSGLVRAAEIELAQGALAVAYSAHSGQVYAAQPGGKIAVIDGESFELSTTVSLEPGLSSFAVSPDGRFGFALHQSEKRLTIIDLSNHTVAFTVPTTSEPDHLDFTETFAYIRYATSGDMLLVDLGSLARGGKPLLSPVTMGQQAPASGRNETIAPMIAPLPEGGGVLAMNASDRAIYHFVEGMNAPMGSYQTYPWPARGVLISDRTIRELGDGVYQTEFRAPRAGTYTLPILVPTSPQLFGCFTLEVVSRPGKTIAHASLQIDPLPIGHSFESGVPQTVRVRLRDATSGEPVEQIKDLMILLLEGPTWQWKGVARPDRDGFYAVDVTFPHAGRFMLMAESRSRGLQFGQLRTLSVTVGAASANFHGRSQPASK